MIGAWGYYKRFVLIFGISIVLSTFLKLFDRKVKNSIFEVL